jgi:UDP-N-acetylglucosamine--N-acetylmuramyl-(pentapeptide) pyrophosphoryl-undecaprenol N-acetylglucosamine transferase
MSTYIFAGGGTGGHLYPGLAVAAELAAIEPGAQIVFACSNRAIDRKILDPLPYAVVPQPILPLPRGLREILPFLRSYRASARQSRDMIADLKPAAVLGLGGFAAGPVVVRAAKQGVRRAFLNPDAVPGKANRLLARHAEAIFTQFDETVGHFPRRYHGKVRCVGCPIRSNFAAAVRQEGLSLFGLREGPRTLLVFGGSLGAESISLSIEALAGDLCGLAGAWQVLHVSGSPKAPAIEEKLKAAGLSVKTLAYCHRMDLAYAAADLVLARAGAGTVAELTATATPSILMPYPYHKDQHQRLNAAALASTGAAVLCDDAKDPVANAASLRRMMLPLMADPAALEKMRAAARGLAKPDAARQVAEWLAGK